MPCTLSRCVWEEMTAAAARNRLRAEGRAPTIGGQPLVNNPGPTNGNNRGSSSSSGIDSSNDKDSGSSCGGSGIIGSNHKGSGGSGSSSGTSSGSSSSASQPPVEDSLDPWERRLRRLEADRQRREAEIKAFQRQHWIEMKAAAARNRAHVLGDLMVGVGAEGCVESDAGGGAGAEVGGTGCERRRGDEGGSGGRAGEDAPPPFDPASAAAKGGTSRHPLLLHKSAGGDAAPPSSTPAGGGISSDQKDMPHPQLLLGAGGGISSGHTSGSHKAAGGIASLSPCAGGGISSGHPFHLHGSAGGDAAPPPSAPAGGGISSEPSDLGEGGVSDFAAMVADMRGIMGAGGEGVDGDEGEDDGEGQDDSEGEKRVVGEEVGKEEAGGGYGAVSRCDGVCMWLCGGTGKGKGSCILGWLLGCLHACRHASA